MNGRIKITQETVNYYKNKWETPNKNLLNFLRKYKNKIVSMKDSIGTIETIIWDAYQRKGRIGPSFYMEVPFSGYNPQFYDLLEKFKVEDD